MLTLEGAQAGLSWLTILKKREGYREAFLNFEPERVAEMSDSQLERLLTFEGIVRNRLKVFSTRKNAKAFLEIQREFGSFDCYLWDWGGGQPIVNRWKTLRDVPPKTDLSDQISKDLKKRGMTFVGGTIIYALMQSTGMVNDHTTDCFRHRELART